MIEAVWRVGVGVVLLLCFSWAAAGQGVYTIGQVDVASVSGCSASTFTSAPLVGAVDATAVVAYIDGQLACNVDSAPVARDTFEVVQSGASTVVRKLFDLCNADGSQCGVGTFGWAYVEYSITNPVCPVGETFDAVMGNCEPPPECDAGGDLGKRFLERVDVVAWPASGDKCMTGYGDGCVAVNVGGVCVGSYCTQSYQITDEACGLEPVDAVGQGEDLVNCRLGGEKVCVDPGTPSGCVYINDSLVCAQAVPEGGCSLAGQGAACNPPVTSPPAPDDGVTPGTPAVPDETLQTSVGDVINYYNSSTVNNSSGAVEGTADAAGGDGTGDQGEGSASSSAGCSAPPSCDGNAIQCAILRQEWESSCQDVGTEAEILAATGLVGVGVGDVEGSGGDLSTLLDDAGFAGSSRVCNIDVTMDLGFYGVYTIPFSEWCGVFSFAGFLVMVSAGLASMKIIAGGF